MEADTLKITDALSIPMSEIAISSIRAQGAGGQNVNKVASAIHLRFDAAGSNALPDDVKQRLLEMGDQRITSDGVIVIKAQVFRTREKNIKDAMQRLAKLIESALVSAKPRKKTKIPKAAKQKRIDDKRKRGLLKQKRRRVDDD